MERPEFIGENVELCGIFIAAAVVGIGAAAAALFVACTVPAIAASSWALAASDSEVEVAQ